MLGRSLFCPLQIPADSTTLEAIHVVTRLPRFLL